MKKRIRLTESELTNLVSKIINEDSSMMMGKLLNATKGMDESQKDGWIKLIKECIAEFDKENPDFSRDMKVEGVLSGMMLLFILGAILLDFDIAAVLGGAGQVMLVDSQIKKWKKVIECAKNKKNGTSTVQESRMKKSIRLTESELIDLVQKIIKEDEMMGMETSMSSPKKEYTIKQGFKTNSPLSVVELQGTTPFYVNGVEMKKKIILKPEDKISCKDCKVTLVKLINGLASGKYYYINFDGSGNATFTKQ